MRVQCVGSIHSIAPMLEFDQSCISGLCRTIYVAYLAQHGGLVGTNSITFNLRHYLLGTNGSSDIVSFHTLKFVL